MTAALARLGRWALDRWERRTLDDLGHAAIIGAILLAGLCALTALAVALASSGY